MLSLFTRPGSQTCEAQRNATALMAPALIFAVALLLRAWHLAAECPWHDEIITLQYLNANSLSRFLEAVAPQSGAVPPLYFTLEYTWAHWIFPSETSLRWLSITFGELTVVVVYLIGRRLFGRLAGCVAAAGLAVNAAHITFSQEIRMYALMYLLAAVSAYTFLELLRRWNWWLLIGHILSNLLLAWTHPYGLLIGVPEGLVLLACRERTFRQKSAWVITHLVIGWSILVWLETRDSMSVMKNMSWLGKPGFFAYPGTPNIQTFLLLCMGGDISVPKGEIMGALASLRGVINPALITILAIAAALVTWDELRRNASADSPRVSGFLWLWLLLPPALLVAVSYYWVPSFVYRYVLYCAIPAYLFIGGFAVKSGRGPRVAITLTLALLAVYQAAFILSQPMRSDWRGAANAIASSPNRSHPVVVMKYQCCYALRYYLGRSRRSVAEAADVREMITKMNSLLRDSKGVWLVLNDIGLEPVPSSERLDKVLRQAGLTFAKQTFQTASPVSLYHVCSNAVQGGRFESILRNLKSGGRANGP